MDDIEEQARVTGGRFDEPPLPRDAVAGAHDINLECAGLAVEWDRDLQIASLRYFDAAGSFAGDLHVILGSALPEPLTATRLAPGTDDDDGNAGGGPGGRSGRRGSSGGGGGGGSVGGGSGSSGSGSSGSGSGSSGGGSGSSGGGSSGGGDGGELILAWRSPTESVALTSDRSRFVQLQAQLAGRTDGCMVDQTGGIAALRITGARTQDLLVRIGSSASYPAPGEARTTRIAELPVMALCVAEGEILLLVERVYLDHLLGWIGETAADFGERRSIASDGLG